MRRVKTCIVWFRNDLRLQDHPMLAYAVEQGYKVLPVYVYEKQKAWSWGSASQWWLHHALKDLDASLQQFGARLHLLQSDGDVQRVFADLIAESSAEAVFWSRRYDAESIQIDSDLKQTLSDQGLAVKSFSASLLHEPFRVKTGSGTAYKVFTAYWKKVRDVPLRSLVDVDLRHAHWVSTARSLLLEEFHLLPSLSWDESFYEYWNPTREGAEKLLRAFSESGVREYSVQRDFLAEAGTSQLSPYLAFGQISPIEIYHALDPVKAASYVRQLYWRDFSYYMIYHFPQTPQKPLRSEWGLFPWLNDEEKQQAWCEGNTGIPVVDAALRQLWKTGWMHNRARMLVGSVLVKYFQQDWMVGARWFWDTLVDADLANNTMGWQWVAGCGADAAPYFRVFNPVTQGLKFDPRGEYVRRYVPELAQLPNAYIHCPWDAPKEVLEEAGVQLGENYPHPMVLPKKGREIALAQYATFKVLSKREG